MIVDKATAFNVNEMVPGFDDFSECVLYMGGDDGKQSVVMVHPHAELEGSRPLGMGLHIGGIAAAKQAVAEGALEASRCVLTCGGAP